MPSIHDQPDWDDLKARAVERMAQVDAQDPEVRRLIYDFNTNAVVAAFQAGYHTPEAIRHFLTAQRRAGVI